MTDRDDDKKNGDDVPRPRRRRGVVFWVLFAIVIVIYATRGLH